MPTFPEYDRPPVVETVLGVQFARLPFTAAHVGWYWNKFLGLDEWRTAAETVRLEDVFERFGDERVWQLPGFRLTPPETTRIQITRADDQRMIQVQDTRFVYNWQRKEGAGYPTYRRLRPEFERYFDGFESFLRDAGLATSLSLNQWEVVYVNLIPIHTVWERPDDLKRVFPGLYVPYAGFETLTAQWSHQLDKAAGRLYVEFQHVKARSTGDESIKLQFTARGPVPNADRAALFGGFELGHAAIVDAFNRMTSDDAQRYWGRQ